MLRALPAAPTTPAAPTATKEGGTAGHAVTPAPMVAAATLAPATAATWRVWVLQRPSQIRCHRPCRSRHRSASPRAACARASARPDRWCRRSPRRRARPTPPSPNDGATWPRRRCAAARGRASRQYLALMGPPDGDGQVRAAHVPVCDSEGEEDGEHDDAPPPPVPPRADLLSRAILQGAVPGMASASTTAPLPLPSSMPGEGLSEDAHAKWAEHAAEAAYMEAMQQAQRQARQVTVTVPSLVAGGASPHPHAAALAPAPPPGATSGLSRPLPPEALTLTTTVRSAAPRQWSPPPPLQQPPPRPTPPPPQPMVPANPLIISRALPCANPPPQPPCRRTCPPCSRAVSHGRSSSRMAACARRSAAAVPKSGGRVGA